MEGDEHDDHNIARTLGVKSQATVYKLTDSTSEPKASTANYLSFPRPALDGSLPDLIVTTPREPTPPAALSSLGAKAAQQQGTMTRNMADSVSSLADSTYDMVDDASELSTEDRTVEEDFSADDADTVSLTSTERRSSNADGFTPEGSVVDLDEHVMRNTASTTATEPSMSQQPPTLPSQSDAIDIGDFRRQVSQAFEMEDEPADSILSDDLETPRQSTLSPRMLAGNFGPSFSTSNAAPSQCRSVNVLFLAADDILPEEKTRVFKRLASALAGTPRPGVPECRITKLPPTPSGICPTSSIIYGCGDVELSVQHCTDVQARPAPYGTREKRTYLFRIADVDDEKLSSMFALGRDIKGEMQLPQLTIFYTSAPKYEQPPFFEVAHNVFKYEHAVPRLVLGKGSQGTPPSSDNNERNMSLRSFYNCDSSSLKQVVEQLLGIDHSEQALITEDTDLRVKPTTTSTRDDRTSWVSQARSWLLRDLHWFGVICMIFAFTYGLTSMREFKETQDRDRFAAHHAIRRWGVESWLGTMTNTSVASAANTFNISHLVPDPETLDPDELSVHYQHVPPNQLVFTFVKGAKQPRYPTLLQFNTTRGRTSVQGLCMRIMDGFYMVRLDNRDAHGLLDFSILTTNPAIAANFTQDFGTSLLQRAKLAQKSTYERAMSKLNTSKLLHDEVGPGYRATRNVTTQLAVQMAKDLQLFAKTAMGFATKAAKAGNVTAQQVSKELALVQKDLAVFGHHVHDSFRAATSSLKSLRPSKESVRIRLATSREKALSFKAALKKSKKSRKETKTALKKSLANYFPLEQLIKPFKRETGLVRRVTDVAQCVRLNGLGEFKKCRDDASVSVIMDSKKHKRVAVNGKQEKKACKKNRNGPAPKKKAEQELRNTHRGRKDEVK